MEYRGMPMEYLWDIMQYHGNPLNISGISWNIMEYLRNIHDFGEYPKYAMKYNGISLNI